jgi:hypothetical protein
VQHAWPEEVIDILRLAGGLFSCIEAIQAVTDGGMNGVHAALDATMPATASTIF